MSVENFLIESINVTNNIQGLLVYDIQCRCCHCHQINLLSISLSILINSSKQCCVCERGNRLSYSSIKRHLMQESTQDRLLNSSVYKFDVDFVQQLELSQNLDSNAPEDIKLLSEQWLNALAASRLN